MPWTPSLTSKKWRIKASTGAPVLSGFTGCCHPWQSIRRKVNPWQSSWIYTAYTALKCPALCKQGLTNLLVALVLLGLLTGYCWEQLVQIVNFIPNSLNMPKGSIRRSWGLAGAGSSWACWAGFKAARAHTCLKCAALSHIYLILFHRKEVKVFKRSKKQEQEKGKCL